MLVGDISNGEAVLEVAPKPASLDDDAATGQTVVKASTTSV